MSSAKQPRMFENMGDLIDRTRDMAKPALIDLGGEGGARTFSYAEFDAMANAAARALAKRGGLKRGDRIAILAANSAEFLATYCGAMRAGFIAVPVNFKFPAAGIELVLRDADAKLVFCDQARRKDVPADLPAIVFNGTDGEAFETFLDPGAFEAVVPAVGETGMFLYTSGSTGRPKGVVLSHASHIWVAQTRQAGKDWSSQRLLVAAPLYHMNAQALSLFAQVAHATMVLMPQFNARAYIQAIVDHRCTWLTAVPPMMAMMLRERDLMDSVDLSVVQHIRMGSAPVSQSLMDALNKYFPKAAIMNAYGTTEAGPVVFGPHPKGLPTPNLSVGFPHPKVQLRLRDAAGNLADEGVLEMKSPALMDGYHGMPEATAKAITADGYYVTGDVLRRDAEGFHYFVGRVDDMFVSGGENIYPGEVEKMLERHTAVEQACVVPVPDEIKGTKPVAFVVLRRNGPGATEQQLKEYALANAPAYQHPRRVWFVAEIPLAGTNKIDRRKVEGMARERLAEAGAAA
jgi:long-chain acyl-CoA synthetase